MFDPDSQNGLLFRVKTLEEQVGILTVQMEAMREQLAASGQGGLFSQKQESITIQVAREGDLPWYIWDADDSKRLPVGADDLTGRFISLEIQDREFKGRPTSVLILRVASGSQVARLRIGSVVWGGDKEFSGSVKTFLEHLDRIPDQDLKGRELKFMPYAGRDEKVSMVAIIDPQTGKSFPKIKEDQDNWHNETYWKSLLDKALTRINAASLGENPTPPVKVSESRQPEPKKKPSQSQPAAKDRTGEPISFVGSIALLVPEQLKRWSDEEDDRITRASLRVTVRRELDGRDIPCMLKDSLAVKVATLYHPTQRVSCSGVRAKDEKGKPIALLDVLEPAVSA
jgi:hypothetical protein